MNTAALRRRISTEERRALARLTRTASLSAEQTERARIVLAVLDGVPPAAIARQAGLPRTTVYSWVRRFAVAGVVGLDNQPRRGRSEH
jgi:transposase-like protein